MAIGGIAQHNTECFASLGIRIVNDWNIEALRSLSRSKRQCANDLGKVTSAVSLALFGSAVYRESVSVSCPVTNRRGAGRIPHTGHRNRRVSSPFCYSVIRGIELHTYTIVLNGDLA